MMRTTPSRVISQSSGNVKKPFEIDAVVGSIKNSLAEVEDDDEGVAQEFTATA